METIAMKCASCGAGLQIAPDMDRFACGYCGASLSVVRQGGTVCLKHISNAIAMVQSGTDQTAAELALVRLKKELANLEKEIADLIYPSLPVCAEPQFDSCIEFFMLKPILYPVIFGWIIGGFLFGMWFFYTIFSLALILIGFLKYYSDKFEKDENRKLESEYRSRMSKYNEDRQPLDKKRLLILEQIEAKELIVQKVG